MNPPLLADTSQTAATALRPALDLRRSLWHRHARCAGVTDLFFAPDEEPVAARKLREAQALALCAECPVRAICRETARQNREIGVWGGETDEDRARAGHPPRNLSRRSVIRAAREGRAERLREAG